MNHSRATFSKLQSKPYVFQKNQKIIAKSAKWSPKMYTKNHTQRAIESQMTNQYSLQYEMDFHAEANSQTK